MKLLLLSILTTLACFTMAMDTPEVSEEEDKVLNQNAELDRVQALLSSQGIAMSGVEVERKDTLRLVYRVFSDSRVKKRKVLAVVIGSEMEFDSKTGTLTLGKTQSADHLVRFILKKVPRR